ncbi:hypothetical protein [Desertivibrio insolitus]|uniref:hypothetical protein n=1 Tax=Herbiconiux sp. SYSU D00978 TaxID=2812562 RepID=UPI001A969256|nr:hypothetical protein [Herbiconiux sp. SYSU D00978]
METSSPRVGLPVAVATVVLAGAAALVFAVGDAIGSADAVTETLSTGAWALAWTLLGFAALLAVGCAVALVRGVVAHRHPTRIEVVLFVVGVAVIVAAAATHPLWGSGSGTG